MMLEIKIQLNEVATGKHLITPLFLSLADVLSWCLKKEEEEEAWSRKKKCITGADKSERKSKETARTSVMTRH